jgi:hypothetical protein
VDSARRRPKLARSERGSAWFIAERPRVSAVAKPRMVRADPLALCLSGQRLFTAVDPPDFQSCLQIQYPPRPSLTMLGPIQALSRSRLGSSDGAASANSA